MINKDIVPSVGGGAGYVVRQWLTGYWKRLASGWAIFRKQPVGMFGLIVILIFFAMVIIHPILIATIWDPNVYDPVIGFDPDIILHPSPPSATHWLGTDPLGRDVFSQLLYSARNEFVLGIVAALVTLVIATSVGAIAAYFPGPVDATLMRIADLVIMMPAVALLIVLGSLWQLNFWTLAVVLGLLAGFGATAIIIKSQALTIKVRPYIDAARATGASHFRIIFSHIVPNLLPLAFLYMMFTVTSAIFSEAFLSFYGILNVRMSWGIMLNVANSQGYLLNFGTWWLLMPAGVAISLLCGSFYLVGRGLDPIVNPRLRKR